MEAKAAFDKVYCSQSKREPTILVEALHRLMQRICRTIALVVYELNFFVKCVFLIRETRCGPIVETDPKKKIRSDTQCMGGA